MAIDIITGFNSASRESLDKRSGPYASLADAKAALDTNERFIGLKVLVISNSTTDGAGNYIAGDLTEYVFDGGITDDDLVEVNSELATALDSKAPLASPIFTGVATIPEVSGDIIISEGASRTIKVARSTNEAGDNLTIEAGTYQSGQEGGGGDLILKGGDGDPGDADGGDVVLQPGTGQSSGSIVFKGSNFTFDNSSVFRNSIQAYGNGSIIRTNNIQANSNADLTIIGRDNSSDTGSGYDISIRAGNSGGDGGNGGDININAGSGETDNGNINIGTSNTAAVNIGSITDVESEINSKPSSSDFDNIVKLTQAEYDALTPDPNTLYIITV